MESGNATNGDEDDMASGTFGYRLGEGAPGAVKVEGLSSIRRDLKKLGGDLDLVKGEFLETNRRIAEIVIGDSKRFVPVLSGALAASLREAATKKSARVKAGGGAVQYAGPIHFGWPARRIKPQPFIYDAVDLRRDEIRERYEKLVDDLIKKHDLDDKRAK